MASVTLAAMRPTSCIVDLKAIEKNVRMLKERAAPTPICAVVKADGYGHGAVQAAEAAIAGGASWLAVAIVEEGIELRNAGITVPILVLSEPPSAGLEACVAHNLTCTVYSSEGLEAISAAATAASKVVDIHLDVDSGMTRVGVQLDEIADFVASVKSYPNLSLTAVWTHCPVADEPDNPFTATQLDKLGAAIREQAPGLQVHVANSATLLTGQAAAAGEPMMVRPGISLYGIDPDEALTGMIDVQPALTLRSEVSWVKIVPPGVGVGYGHRWTTDRETTIATVPIGYADGLRRDLGLKGGSVLIGGKRHPIVGVVTMDQIMVDVGPDSTVARGDEVILIGSQGDEQITAEEMAKILGTIPYELVCAISKRVPRTY